MPTFNTGMLLWPSLLQGNLSHLVIFRKTYNSLPVKGIKSKHVEEANYFPKSKMFILCLAGCRMKTWNRTEQTRTAKSSEGEQSGRSGLPSTRDMDIAKASSVMGH